MGIMMAASASASAVVDPGQALYIEHCSQCHEGDVPRAPHSIMFNMSQPSDILAAMNEGLMQAQAAKLSAQERLLVANFLAGAEEPADSDRSMKMCDSPPAIAGPESAAIGSWGMDDSNHRFIDGETAGINKDNVAQLTLNWAFDFPGATRTRSQPTLYGDVIYLGSQHGLVYAIDLTSGCVHWSFQAEAEVRSAISIAPATSGKPHTLYFGDTAGNVYAISGVDGAAVWQAHLEDHPNATITGSPKLYDGRLFVPMSSREWATAADPNYACCTFRGGIAASF
jgi:polyvinyl alcohol dehydrogenase (cytochrome)